MEKKLDEWHRMFIVLACAWTALSIGLLSLILYDVSHSIELCKEEIEIVEMILQSRRDEKLSYLSNIEREKLKLHGYYEKRNFAIYLFPLYWLVPIGLIYSSGWCTGWIIRGFRKDKE